MKRPNSASGEMFFFGYGFLPSGLDYHVVDSSGQITLSQKIAVPEPTMMHDFQLTATRAVFMDFPLVFDMDEALAGEAMPFVWKPRRPPNSSVRARPAMTPMLRKMSLA